MSGVYIPGMEVPKSCISCPIDKGNYKTEQGAFIWCDLLGRSMSYSKITKDHPRMDDCPLIPVPDHGRLIDADAFEKDQCNSCDGWCDCVECDCLNCNQEVRCNIILELHNAPTVIPADEEEDT